MSETSHRDHERLAALKKHLEDDPRSLAFVTLAEEHNRLGQFAEGAAVAQRGLLTHPDSVAGRLALAVAEAEQDHVKEALEQIKRALIIDQENPRALGLMGRILLKRGLAKRAVQFLSHAVKLAPKEPEYSELLKTARKMAKAEAAGEALPVFGAEQVPDQGSPWTDGEPSEDGGGPAPGSEHTVFDPDALKQLRAGKKLGAALDALPGGDDQEGEPTAYAAPIPKPNAQGELPPPRRVQADSDGRDEPTAYATQNPLPPERPKKAKMGGSAAEYSQMMKRGDAPLPPAVPDAGNDFGAGEETVDGVPPKARSSTTSERPKPTSAPKAPPPPPPADPAPAPRATGPKLVPDPPKEEPKAKAQKSPSNPAPAPEKPAEEKPAKAAAKSAPEAPPAEKPSNKAVGPVATRMVDEALWALFGQKSAVSAPHPAPAGGVESAPAAPGGAAAPAPEGKAPVRAKLKGKEDDEGPNLNAGPAGQVVRTSERFGTWVRVAVMTVLSATALVVGYSLMVTRAGPGLEVAREELKGVATDLDKGGLASLYSVEEQIDELSRGNPGLAVTLAGALAEVNARRFVDFGRNPKDRAAALQALKAQSGAHPSLELVAARVLLSSAAVDRKALYADLELLEAGHAESPKFWLLKGRVLSADGKDTQALESFYRAYALNPKHRATLLELARWHANRPSYGPAFETYEQLREHHPLDVEAAIERYVLASVTGEDPNPDNAVATLAGLVRDEIPEVAKDEAGRAALAFAVPKLAKGQVQDGIDELSKADAAFPESALFRSAVAGAFLAVGDYERARKHYARALELEVQNDQHRIGLARAAFLERSGLRLDIQAEAKRLEKGVDKSGSKFPEVTTPFGSLSLVYGAFELIRFTPDGELFPEQTYAELAESLDGPELQKALESANLVALGHQRLAAGKLDEASGLVSEATALRSSEASRLLEGRIFLAKKEYGRAVGVLKEAIGQDPKSLAGRLTLAKALLAEEKTIEALEVLESFERENLVVPEALQLLGSARLVRGDYEGALRPLEQVVALKVRGAGPYLTLGEVQHRLQRPEAAMVTYRHAVERDPKLAAPLTELPKMGPISMMYLGRAELARNEKRGVALLQEALKSEEVPPEAHYYLGAHWHEKKNKKGKKELEKFLRLASPGELKTEAEKLLRKK
ncbi:MAG: tetratricopeptide repeat protein [Deltaproteobacteria bacterium]|nr:tetratricopeptide repeat protein [Deltaproteobacteria bacterium]